MTDLLTADNTGKSITFTVTKMPRREAQRKTLIRLMQMEPEVKKGLKALQRLRRQKDNHTYQRAGKMWTHRKRATKLVWLERGCATFTITMKPQLIDDLKSVADCLDAKAA